jgi:hypothetical protein
MIKLGNADQVDETMEMLAVMAKHAQRIEQARLIEAIRLFNGAASDRVSSWHPGLLLELALTEAVTTRQEPPPAAPQKAAGKDSGIKGVENAAPEAVTIASQQQPSQPVQNDKAAVEESDTGASEEKEESQPTEDPEEMTTVGEGEEQEVSFQDIAKQWKEISRLVSKQSGKTGGLLNSCRLLGLKKGFLVIGFQSELLQSKMEAGDNIELTCRVIAHLLKTNIQIKCVVSDQESGFNMDELEMDVDGMVGEALNLGGKIAHKK